ncbi:tRNA dihydrouridine(20/20a) synthase DusA [Rhodovulum sulfidophilum]|uniref:tRNA-dihydrouridine(20/20a) synthase n=1 Tax=Rhodovulum visakhapatnamense TaxID=364297 RepID=A0ABS1RE73_9RHOB|nr:tRNA dihydrouridine(20/20a) synthase DusA [Rhodovulum visakhapatnamense]MBL3569228.1 tRNA dihydrouridine(20/20a) synthase DusA [Rhodovulum visakhapatnamense]MBL3577454.1 tRNA dihydrouridine(20/20a) synthase DusA [Rhodovulum visakhapatnamense]OLS44043.1 tRNA dihydrouridine(20/20a) synthase DusA [Rhodovulum sulfidophilum]
MAQYTENKRKYNAINAARLSVAPMMDWTDRHCRYFHRLMSRSVLLYTEMVTAPALVRGGALHLLDHAPAEHPVAVQLGGSDPAELARATRLCCEAGYDEVNLNVGCPSDKVQSGAFGAVLMKTPSLVAECVAAMRAAATVEVTVKCRIGVDDQDPQEVLPAFLQTISAAGATRFTIHARKAWLQGLSPKENRDVPPLDYDLVHEMKQAFPELHLSVNGGIGTLTEAKGFLEDGLDGAMIGRAAYHDPAGILLGADEEIFGQPGRKTARQVAEEMRPYIARHLGAGGRLHAVTRHMLGLFAGRPGARTWRRLLSEGAAGPGAGLDVFDAALEAMPPMPEPLPVDAAQNA